MSSSSEATSTLLGLPGASLGALGAALESGALQYGFNQKSLLPFCGQASPVIEQALQCLITAGFTTSTAGILCLALGRAQLERDAAERSIQLVMSGPEVIGTPVVDTKTTVLSLFEEAQQEVFITSYVFHQASGIFSLLAQKHDANPAFRVTFLVDVTHMWKTQDDTLVKLAQTFGANFRKHHWPGKRLPEVWHDPRRFENVEGERGVLHAKAVIVDRKIAFVTSANFTEAAQVRNIEAGVLIRQSLVAERLYAYFAGLIATNIMRRINC